MPNKAIFLDRDGTLIKDTGYLNDPDQVKLLDGAAEAIAEFKRMGYKLVVVSNQSGVARGIVTEKTLGQIHDRLKQLLAEKKVSLDAIYYCPYHPNGAVAKYRKQSNHRKPDPGMLLAAADEMDIDLNQSWMIGNSGCDVAAGSKAGCKTILLDDLSHTKKLISDDPAPDYRGVNLKEAVNIIKKLNRSQTQQAIEPETAQKSPAPTPNQEVETADRQEIPAETIESLLTRILHQLKNMQRTEMFGEFSIIRLLAGFVQAIVALCLLISVWLLMDPNRHDNSVLIALGFAIVLQVMALTFYIMQGRK